MRGDKVKLAASKHVSSDSQYVRIGLIERHGSERLHY